MQNEEVVLVYLIKEETESAEEIPIKFGGRPVWMYDHRVDRFECQLCKQTLTFLCQLFAPLNSEHTFNRAFYVFFCEVSSWRLRARSARTAKSASRCSGCNPPKPTA